LAKEPILEASNSFKDMFHNKESMNLKLKLSIANCGVRTEFVTPPSFFEKEIRRRKKIFDIKRSW